MDITRVSVSDQVTASLRRLIEDGTVSPGQKMPSETAIAKQYGVGRSTVREAIRTLRAEGLMELIPGKGAFAAEPVGAAETKAAEGSPTAAAYPAGEAAEADFQVLRRLTEPSLAAEAAERMTTENEQAVIRAMADYRAAAEAVNADPTPAQCAAVAEADYRFHRALIRAAENAVAARLFADGHALFVGYMTRWYAALSPYLRDTVQEHELLLQAVVGHGAATAQSRMLTHLTMAERRFS